MNQVSTDQTIEYLSKQLRTTLAQMQGIVAELKRKGCSVSFDSKDVDRHNAMMMYSTLDRRIYLDFIDDLSVRVVQRREF